MMVVWTHALLFPQILERQQKRKPGETEQDEDMEATEEAAIEMGMTRRRVA